MVAEEGRYSLGEKQQSPIAASASYPKERLLATTHSRRTGCPFPHDKHFTTCYTSYTTWGAQPHVCVGSVPSMATPTLFVIRGVIDL